MSEHFCRAAQSMLTDLQKQATRAQDDMLQRLLFMQVISVTVEGGDHICTYSDIHRRSQLMALALKKLGIR